MNYDNLAQENITLKNLEKDTKQFMIEYKSCNNRLIKENEILKNQQIEVKNYKIVNENLIKENDVLKQRNDELKNYIIDYENLIKEYEILKNT